MSEGEFNVVIPKISAFSFIRGCVGDAPLCLFLESMMWGGTLFFSALVVVVGNASNVVCLLFNLNKVLCSAAWGEHWALTPVACCCLRISATCPLLLLCVCLTSAHQELQRIFSVLILGLSEAQTPEMSCETCSFLCGRETATDTLKTEQLNRLKWLQYSTNLHW